MHRLFILFLLFAPLNADEVTNEETTGKYPELPDPIQCISSENEEVFNGECVNKCIAYNPCGVNAQCKVIEGEIYCQCSRGYSGNPLANCSIKHDEKSPCEPNPCGMNSECVAENDEIGPHCKCKPKFYDFPPECRPGCEIHEDCAEDEFCDRKKNLCKKICNPSKCGENSKCRYDKKKLKAFCSCLDGFVPERDVGCREKTSQDSEIPIDFIKEIVNDPCDEKCGRNAFCGSDNKCACTQGYKGNPEEECELIKSPTVLDTCSPNPCGDYSICNIVDGNANCSCVEGYGTVPFCKACRSNGGCDQDTICVGGRCVGDICFPFCGQGASCNIFNETIECFCNFLRNADKPFTGCAPLFIPPNVIATLLG